MDLKLCQADKKDVLEIKKLYTDAIGTSGCTWDGHYPNDDITKGDLERNALFCMKTDTGEIVGAVSIDDDMQVEKLSCWREELKPGAEIARMVVKNEWQNRGIAGKMITELMEIISDRGYKSAHYLVSKSHVKALAAYKKLEFEKVGECGLYDGDWWCFEKEAFKKQK